MLKILEISYELKIFVYTQDLGVFSVISGKETTTGPLWFWFNVVLSRTWTELWNMKHSATLRGGSQTVLHLIFIHKLNGPIENKAKKIRYDLSCLPLKGENANHFHFYFSTFTQRFDEKRFQSSRHPLDTQGPTSRQHLLKASIVQSKKKWNSFRVSPLALCAGCVEKNIMTGPLGP